MKQMRSRFRLISLLLACTLALAVAACAVSVLRENGFTLPPPRQELPASPSHVPETSSEAPPELSPEASADTPAPPGSAGDENVPEETDIRPDSEYNIFGL